MDGLLTLTGRIYAQEDLARYCVEQGNIGRDTRYIHCCWFLLHRLLPDKTPKMKLPDFSFTVGYGNTLTPENLDRLTSEPASYQVVDELIINVLRKDGIPRTLLDIQRKTNMSEAVIRSSLRRLFTHGLVALDATDGTQLERYSIIQNSATEGEIEAQ